MPPLRKIKISSTNSKCERVHWFMILSPLSHPDLFSDKITLLKPSIIIRKSNADSGQPCLIPLYAWKKLEAGPLVRVPKETNVMQHMIHHMKRIGKPRWVRIILMQSQLTRSKAFERSILRMPPFNFFCLMEWRTSWVVPMASCIWQLWRKEKFSKDIF